MILPLPIGPLLVQVMSKLSEDVYTKADVDDRLLKKTDIRVSIAMAEAMIRDILAEPVTVLQVGRLKLSTII